MSHIQDYYRKLDDLQRIAGATNEGALLRQKTRLTHPTWLQHKNILQSVDKYTPELQTFGPVIFKTAKELPPTFEIAVLERRSVGGETTRYALC